MLLFFHLLDLVMVFVLLWLYATIYLLKKDQFFHSHSVITGYFMYVVHFTG